MRTQRGIVKKANGDENATSRHVRQLSGKTIGDALRAPTAITKTGVQRPALGEVTNPTNIRKVRVSKSLALSDFSTCFRTSVANLRASKRPASSLKQD